YAFSPRRTSPRPSPPLNLLLLTYPPPSQYYTLSLHDALPISGKAAENGILFKGGEHLERTHQLNAIILDKTGTITKGKPEVTDFIGDQETLQLLASAEKGSEHPLAEAIVAYATEQN